MSIKSLGIMLLIVCGGKACKNHCCKAEILRKVGLDFRPISKVSRRGFLEKIPDKSVLRYI